MRISRVEIRNFKGIAELGVDLHDRFTLIVGDNGAGKTSVLDALAVASASYLLGIPEATSRHIRKDEIRESVQFFESGPDYRRHLPVSIRATGTIGAQGADEEINWERKLESVNGRTTTKGAFKLKQIAKQDFKRVTENAEGVLPLISYYGTGRLWLEPRRVRQTRKPRRTDAYRNSHEPNVSSVDLITWVRDQHFAELEQERKLSTYTAWRNAVQHAFDSPVSVSYSVARKRLELRFDKSEGSSKNGKPADSHVVSYENLSHGQRTVLSMVGDIAFKAIRLNPALDANAILKTPGIVLIDEIDLHLHPKWQRTIVRSLMNAFPNMQFVATTHSPFVIQSIKTGHVFNLDKREIDAETYNQSVEDIAEEVQGVEMPERSSEHLELSKLSDDFLTTVRLASASTDRSEADKYREKLDRLGAKASVDPATAALLNFQRAASKIDDK